jgi:hypothetical protein
MIKKILFKIYAFLLSIRQRIAEYQVLKTIRKHQVSKHGTNVWQDAVITPSWDLRDTEHQPRFYLHTDDLIDKRKRFVNDWFLMQGFPAGGQIPIHKSDFVINEYPYHSLPDDRKEPFNSIDNAIFMAVRHVLSKYDIELNYFEYAIQKELIQSRKNRLKLNNQSWQTYQEWLN